MKGLPLHLQIDTFDDFREGSLPVNRGYCQIKVFCDKVSCTRINMNTHQNINFQGAERKTRDEERRAAKRKLSATGSKEIINSNEQSQLTEIYFKDGRKKIEDMYHVSTERSEFYTMSDILKPPVLFTPSEELEKVRCYCLFVSKTCINHLSYNKIHFVANERRGDQLFCRSIWFWDVCHWFWNWSEFSSCHR